MIVGLIVFGGLLVYLILTIVLITTNVRSARKQGKSGWKRGLIVFACMYLLLFWDWIPTRVALHYYCATESGFTLNKSLEQWKEENPGVAETLVPYKKVPEEDLEGGTRYILNQRFAWDSYRSRGFLWIEKWDERIVDAKSGAILAQYVDFDSGQKQHNPKQFRDFKLWLWMGSCEGDGSKPSKGKFYKFKYLVKHQKEHR